jgi:hypothetical protein
MFTRDHLVHERALAAVRSALGEDGAAAARETGRTREIEAAIAEAVAQAVAASAPAGRFPI